MLHMFTITFAICAFIKLLQGDTNGFFMYSILVGLYLIPISISDTFKNFFSLCNDALKVAKDHVDDKNEKIKEEMTKKGSTSNN